MPLYRLDIPAPWEKVLEAVMAKVEKRDEEEYDGWNNLYIETDGKNYFSIVLKWPHEKPDENNMIYIMCVDSETKLL